MEMKMNYDGTWRVSKPKGPRGRLIMLEFWLRKRGFERIPALLAAWDETRRK